MRYFLALCLFAVGTLAHADASPSLEDRKIQYLIAAVETLPDAQFIRNGIAYDAKTAADHLRTKLKMAGSHVATAEDFIRLCASDSSISGSRYQIRFSDGRTVTSESYLRHKLAEWSAE